MLSIRETITVDVGDSTEKLLHLWLMLSSEYDPTSGEAHWPQFVEAVAEMCAERGWLLECDTDPLVEGNTVIINNVG